MSADQELASGTGVRRHHTISASSRPAREPSRSAIAEEGTLSHDDDVVDEDWDGPVGAVGEKNAGLHRQASLPTSRHYVPRGVIGSSRTPKHMPSLNSLSAIAGQEGDEEDWEKDIRGVRDQEEIELANDGAQNTYDDGSHLAHGAVPSPPLADSGVRRHQSMTARGSHAHRGSTNLRRSGTLQTTAPRHQAAEAAGVRSPSPTEAEEEYEYEQHDEEDPYADDSYADDAYFVPPQAQGVPIQQQNVHNGYAMNQGVRSPWANPGAGDWHSNAGMSVQGASNDVGIDDVQRALSSLELSSARGSQGPPPPGAFQPGQSAHPPRFNPAHSPPAQQPGGANLRRAQPINRKYSNSNEPQNLALQTDVSGAGPGPLSAGAYLSHGGGQAHSRSTSERSDGTNGGRERAFSAAGAPGQWDQNRRLGNRTSNPNLQYAYGQPGGQNIPSVPPLPAQYQQQQQQPRLGVATGFGQGMQGQVGGPMNQQGAGQGQPVITSPVDVPSLIATKGYNPVNFDTKPSFARYFVIKSYTEEDVHKSIKYEIWSSTDPGNKRLDKAFKETAGRGPIYLFFSVNASGHFCGMAEMLTPVDLTRSSTVWASDKWKGVFKVRWIFVRDIPNATLRHIKLNNTQERKPVTNSRDTQELLPDAGHEMLRIFHTHPARTSLLQDFSYYELQAAQKTVMASPPPVPAQARMQSPQPGPPQMSPTLQQQHPYAMTNPAALAYVSQQQLLPQQMSPVMGGMSPMMSPMMHPAQMGGLNAPYAMQNIMRNPSPGPGPGPGPANGQYMGMHGRF